MSNQLLGFIFWGHPITSLTSGTSKWCGMDRINPYIKLCQCNWWKHLATQFFQLIFTKTYQISCWNSFLGTPWVILAFCWEKMYLTLFSPIHGCFRPLFKRGQKILGQPFSIKKCKIPHINCNFHIELRLSLWSLWFFGLQTTNPVFL